MLISENWLSFYKTAKFLCAIWASDLTQLQRVPVNITGIFGDKLLDNGRGLGLFFYCSVFNYNGHCRPNTEDYWTLWSHQYSHLFSFQIPQSVLGTWLPKTVSLLLFGFPPVYINCFWDSLMIDICCLDCHADNFFFRF